MGVVTTLQDVRQDVAKHCPPEALKEYDWAMEKLCEWEADDRDHFAKGLWIGAILGGAFIAALALFALALTQT